MAGPGFHAPATTNHENRQKQRHFVANFRIKENRKISSTIGQQAADTL
jgi:hypothetical protein